MILKLFVFIKCKISRDDFTRKKKLHAVTRLVFPYVEDKKMAETVSAASFEYVREWNTR